MVRKIILLMTTLLPPALTFTNGYAIYHAFFYAGRTFLRNKGAHHVEIVFVKAKVNVCLKIISTKHIFPIVIRKPRN
jgi:hypothetical protein